VKPAIAMAAVALTSLVACNTNRRVGDMEANRNRPVAHLTDAAIRSHEELFPGNVSKVKETDPELIEVFDNFALDEVLRHGDLDVKTRVMVILASTLGSQALSEYKVMLGAALNVGVTPVEAKEILYQAVPYVGIAKVLDFIHATNEVLQARGVALPLPPQSTTNRQTRREKGLEVQRRILGDRIDQMYAESPKDLLHIQEFLTANCFGDYVARGGLDLKTRELLTFSMLAALGGCEPQLAGHVAANLAVGNDRRVLVGTITQLLPYIGYPRTLNAIRVINEGTSR
jgi:4-carboxymuconolactone decarboxylase